MLHPLNEEQLSLLNEYKESGLSLRDFANRKNITFSKISYLVYKDRRLNETEENISLDSFIPINLNNNSQKEDNYNIRSSNKVNITINGFNINISINDLKELLK